MNFLSSASIFLQVIGALVIFVVAYVALLLCAIAGLLIADLIYKGARLLWPHLKQSARFADVLLAKLAGGAHTVLCQVEIIRNHVAPARRSNS
jgi:hypothetical protein